MHAASAPALDGGHGSGRAQVDCPSETDTTVEKNPSHFKGNLWTSVKLE